MSRTTTSGSAVGLEKAATGIEGFGAITGGGLPRNRATLVLGETGCGKTILALQTLANGARQWNEPGIFVAFEEHALSVIANTETFGWNFPELIREGKLFILDANVSPQVVQSGEFDLTAIIAIVSAKATEMGAKRVVFDGIDVLLALLDDPAWERREVYRLHDWLTHSGMTGIITTKSLPNTMPGSVDRYGFMPFMVDCSVQLTHRLSEQVSLRELRVLKYRGSSFSENAFPMIVGPAGVEVASPAQAVERRASSERISTGVERLDTMLSGGYLQGSSILISGSPGTAKSTLASAFLASACARGERALYVSFDESGPEILRNMASVGLELTPHVESGLLRLHSARADTQSAEAHLLTLRRLLRLHEPRVFVIDPISAPLCAGGHVAASGVAMRLLQDSKAAGVTTISTTLMDATAATGEGTAAHISTIADTWLHLSYVAHGGERNRALTICKARGTKHSNQVRELILDEKGITLADVYMAGGEVLMGTARWEREAAERSRVERHRAEVERRRIELSLAEAEVAARIEVLKRELEAKRADLTLLTQEQTTLSSVTASTAESMRDLRSADARSVHPPRRIAPTRRACSSGSSSSPARRSRCGPSRTSRASAGSTSRGATRSSWSTRWTTRCGR